MAQRESSLWHMTFRLCCWIATISLICKWLYKYSQDEDLCEVDYRNYYQTDEDLTPELSLCFNSPFSQEKLEKFGVNETKYKSFLEGMEFDSDLVDIDFNSISMNPNDYVGSNWVSWRNGTPMINVSTEIAPFFEKSYSGFIQYAGFVNCFVLKLPSVVNMSDIENFGVMISYNIFPSGTRPPLHGLDVLIHYPNQLLRSLETLKYGWDPRNVTEITMRFKIIGMEIIRHRNKKNHPCSEEWKSDDDRMLVTHTNEIGCRAPYQNPSSKIRKCNSSKELSASKFTLSSSGYKSKPPCKMAGKIYYKYDESVYNANRFGNFWIGIWLTGSQFKEIVKTRAIDMNGLIGNIGGYIGLCLGYSILQLPEFVSMMTVVFKRKSIFPSRKDIVKDDVGNDDHKGCSSNTTKVLRRDFSKGHIAKGSRCWQDEAKDINVRLCKIERLIETLIQKISK